VGSRGKIDRLEVRVDVDGVENGLVVSNAPTIEYAAVARLAEPSRPPTFFNELSREFVGGFITNVPSTVVGPRDVGLGLPTFAFQGNLFSGARYQISVSSYGDLQPHYFVVDGWLVISTSPRLSKTVLAAWRDTSQQFAAPRAGNAKLIAFGRLPGETLASGFESYWQLLSDLLSGQGSVKIEGPLSEMFGGRLRLPTEAGLAMGETTRLLNEIAWTTVDGSEVRLTRVRATFADAPKRF
jgi:hypothetical protein